MTGILARHPVSEDAPEVADRIGVLDRRSSEFVDHPAHADVAARVIRASPSSRPFSHSPSTAEPRER